LALAAAGGARAASLVGVAFEHEMLAEVRIDGHAAVTDLLVQSPALLASDERRADDAIAGAAASAFATQFSSLAAASFTSFGSADASGVFLDPLATNRADGLSRVTMTFSVDEAVIYSIEYTLTVSESRGEGLASVELREIGGPTLGPAPLTTPGDVGPLVFSSGLLVPGKLYELEARASAHVQPAPDLSGTAAAGYRINFSILAIPEPDTLASLGLGLASLAWTGRRRRGNA
jgi:hypothetical protein